jgi:glucose/arabinose dehydrogenase
MVRRALVIVLGGIVMIACRAPDPTQPPSTQPSPTGNTIALDSSIVYQTMSGWEESSINTVVDYFGILPFTAPLRDQAVNDLGLNSISIGISPSSEHPVDCEAQYLAGALSERAFVDTCAYVSVNDNSDPNIANLAGFHFTLLDWQIEQLVLPFKQRIEARGEHLRVVVRFVDFGPSPFEHYQFPAEYAELLLVAFDHIKSKYGFIPDGVDVINEPDNVSGWTGPVIGNVIAATGPRLAAAGYRPAFIVPSTVNKANAAPFLDAIMSVAGARPYVKELAWHCYADSGANTSTAIANKAIQYGVSTSMTECWTDGNTYLMLHQELKASRNSLWQLALIHSQRGYYDVNPSTGQITLRPKARFIRQYYKYVRAGARRIEALTGNPTFDPVAFINADGKYVVVVKASAGGSFTVRNLPPGTYGIFYTTGPDGLTVSNYDVHLADQTLTTGQTLTTSIPSTGVITIHAKASTAASIAPLHERPAEDTDVSKTTRREVAATTWPNTTVVAKDGTRLQLEQIGDVVDPTDAAFTPDGRLFVTERTGSIRVVHDRRLLTQPALSLPEGGEAREQLLALTVDPDFTRTHYIYTISATRSKADAPTFCLSRFRESSDTLADRVVLLDEIVPSDAPVASLRFGPDGKLFAAFDDGGLPGLAGDLASMNGKVLRLNPDGTTPDDQAGGNPLFSYGYRSPRGLAWRPGTDTLWIADRDTPDSSQVSVVAVSDHARQRGVVRTTVRLPRGTLASALAFYGSKSSTPVHDNLLVASDEGRHLLRIQLDPQQPSRVVATERLLQDVIGGIRIVAVGHNGVIYLGTATALGRLVLE